MEERNLINTAFRGKGDFIGNHYAVWQNGIPETRIKPDGEEYTVKERNWWAFDKGLVAAKQLISSKRSTHKLSTYSKFLDHLKQIQAKEADKERRYLLHKYEELERQFAQDEFMTSLYRAIMNEDYGTAYTLVTKKDKDIDELRRELKSNKFQSVQKMNSFWHSQFFKYFEKRIAEQMQVRKGHLEAKFSNNSLTIDEIVDEWLDEMLMGGEGISQDSLYYIENQFKEGLVSFFEQKNIGVHRGSNILGLDLDALLDTKSVQKVYARKNKKSHSRTAKARISDISEAMGNWAGRGLSTEIMAIAEQASSNKKGVTISAGAIAKKIADGLRKEGYDVFQKNDVVGVEHTSNIPIGEIADSIYQSLAENGGDVVSALEQQLGRIKYTLGDIFVIETNVKGYISKQNLTIEGKGSWRNRLDNLSQMKDVFPNRTMDKLIFLMVNMVDGCLADKKREQLKDYIAAAVAAWLWDDYDQLYNVNEQTNFNRVRMFKSGSYYFSASQIMQQGIEALENSFNKEETGFIRVGFSVPKINAEEEYAQLRRTHPVEQAIEDGDEEEVQNILAARWDAMRDRILDSGTMEIKFDQEELERLLGNLEQYVF